MQLTGGSGMGGLGDGWNVAMVGCEAVVLVAVAAGAAVVWVLHVMHASVGVDKPTAAQLQEEKHENHPLFRHFPSLKHRLAWYIDARE